MSSTTIVQNRVHPSSGSDPYEYFKLNIRESEDRKCVYITVLSYCDKCNCSKENLDSMQKYLKGHGFTVFIEVEIFLKR